MVDTRFGDPADCSEVHATTGLEQDRSGAAYGDRLAQLIVGHVVERLLRRAYDSARAALSNRSKELSRLAEALVEFETVDRAEMDAACAGDFKKIRQERATQSERKKIERAANVARVEPATVLIRDDKIAGKSPI